MNSSNSSARAIKRILHDLEEIRKSPVAGISVCMPDVTNPFKLHGNVIINEGAYEGLLVHVIFNIPEDYPIRPPAVNLAPRLDFGHKYHHHIYNNPQFGNSICTDLTSNFAGYFKSVDDGRSVQSGWTPGYTLTAVLMQLAIFFADPDLPARALPTKEEVERLKKHVLGYKLDINVNDGTTTKTITHSYEQPYPALDTLVQGDSEVKKISEEKPEAKEGNTTDISQAVNSTFPAYEEQKSTENGQQNQSTDTDAVKAEIANKLVCSINKVNIFDSSKPILGYPLDVSQDKFGRIWVTPITDMLSYDAYMLNFEDGTQPNSFKDCGFKSGFGLIYNFWMPVYINKDHFELSKQKLLNALSVIYKSIEGKEHAIKSLMALKVLPPILVKTFIHFLKGTVYQSIAAIDAYCQFYYLFAQLAKMFPALQKAINQEVTDFCAKDSNRHKKVAGDLGEFMIKLALSSKGLDNPETINLLLKEHTARQIFWALKADPGLKASVRPLNFLKRFMTATKTSNEFFMVQLESAKLLLDPEVKKELESNFGVLSQARMDAFRARINWIQNNMDNWECYIQGIKQGKYIKNENEMLNLILEGFSAALKKGYCK